MVRVAVLFGGAFHEVSGVAGESSGHYPRAVRKIGRGRVSHILVEFYFVPRPVGFILLMGWMITFRNPTLIHITNGCESVTHNIVYKGQHEILSRDPKGSVP